MLKKKGRSLYPAVVVLTVIFLIGLILGTVSFFYVPEDLVIEARETLNTDVMMQGTFYEIFKNNFMMELIWIISVWLLGCVSFTAPLTGAIMSLRGFLIGFSVTFALMGNRGLNFITCYIIPQCIIAFPIMTFFATGCILLSVERKHGDSINLRYFVYGAVFVAITALSSLLEVFLMQVFIRYL